VEKVSFVVSKSMQVRKSKLAMEVEDVFESTNEN